MVLHDADTMRDRSGPVPDAFNRVETLPVSIEIAGERLPRYGNGFPDIRIPQQVGHHAVISAGKTRLLDRPHLHGIGAFFPGGFDYLFRFSLGRSATHGETAAANGDRTNDRAGPGDDHVLG